MPDRRADRHTAEARIYSSGGAMAIGSMDDLVDSFRGDTELVREGWIRRTALDSALDEATTSKRVPVQLWYLLVLERWLEAHKGAAVPAGVR